ncbi:hypothetical protein [Burkholderia ubonensis]|uniref:hypothetical protein n=1 Tax=Burkholderia ubonensis TaxID=101571 RepID=UPI000A7C2D14|nr:hypothetical protein [Burkholderia ubonensis]
MAKTRFIAALACVAGSVAFSSAALAEGAGIWRVPAPVVYDGVFGSVIKDRGEMHRAVPNQHGEFVFSEVGAGVQPLAIIGTPAQIAEFMLKHETRGIENKIADTPDIYVGVTKYVPNAQFTGLFPLGDAVVQLAQ